MEFHNELSESQLDELKYLVEQSGVILRRSHREIRSGDLDLKTIGQALYRLIFSEDLQSLLEKNTSPLLISGGEPSFPWEILHDGKDFLGLKFPISRIPSWLHLRSKVQNKVELGTGEFPQIRGKSEGRFIFCADPLSKNIQARIETEFIYNSIPRELSPLFLKGANITKRKLQELLSEKLADGVKFLHLVFPVHPLEPEVALYLNGETFYPFTLNIPEPQDCWLFLQLYLHREAALEGERAADSMPRRALELAHSFIEQGFAGVAVSLYPDFSREMSTLITLYYEGVLQGIPPATALMKAKKAMAEGDPLNPVWAKVIYLGDPILPALSKSYKVSSNLNSLSKSNFTRVHKAGELDKLSDSSKDHTSIEGGLHEGALEYDFDLEQAIGIALMEAKNLRQDFIGTPHLFIGLTKCPGGVTRALLETAGFDPKKVRDTIRYALGFGHAPIDAKILPTQRCVKALKTAEQNARREGDSMVREKHLLAAILQSGEGLAFEVLKKMGADPQVLYQRLMREDFDKKRKQNDAIPTIERYGRDLTQLARENKLPPLMGRSEELMRLTQILLRRFKNNPLIVGEAGVGKTAIVEGLAQRIVAGAVPRELQNRRIIELSLSSLVAGTRYRGDFEERLTQVIKEAKENPDVILFLDEFHTVVGAGETHQGTLDAANILKPALARGEIRCIGATTPSEYRKYIEKDAALERRFHPLFIEEPSPEEALDIMEGSRPGYETHHQVSIPQETLQAAIQLSIRYLPHRRLPDKALDLIDEACALVNLRGTFSSLLTPDGKIRPFKKRPSVTVEALYKVISDWTGIPIGQISKEENRRLLELSRQLEKRVLGQPEAIAAVTEAIQLGRTGLRHPDRPIAVLLFIGPSGVGKTELSKALAAELFGDEKALIRIDMSEFSEKHSSSKMLGAPPGYVGYGEESPLLSKLHQKPYSVVLFDEIEKAHPSILDLFLQLFEDGRITDAVGRTVDGRHAVFIMTSNILSERFWKQPKKVGFTASRENTLPKDQIREELFKHFRPEFINRIDDIVIFSPLSEEVLLQIAKQQLQQLAEMSLQKGILLSADEEALKYLVKQSVDPAMGARPLLRQIESKITRPLSQIILRYQSDNRGDKKTELQIKFTLIEGHPTLQILRDTAAPTFNKKLDTATTE